MLHKCILWLKSQKHAAVLFIFALTLSYLLQNMFFYMLQIYKSDSDNLGISANSIYFRVEKKSSFEVLDFEFMRDYAQINKINLFKGVDTSTSLYNCILFNDIPAASTGRAIETNMIGTAYAGCKAGAIFDLNNLIINGLNYEVIGSFESEFEAINYMIYYIEESVDSVVNDDFFVIDGETQKSINAAYEYIDQHYKGQDRNIYMIEQNETHISDFLSYRKPVIFVALALILILLFTNIMVTVYWFNANSSYIQISNILGLEWIIPRLMAKMTSIMFMASLFSYVIFALINKSNPVLILPVTLITISIIVICSIPLAKKTSNYDWILLENDYENY